MKCKVICKDGFLPYFIKRSEVQELWNSSNAYYIEPAKIKHAYNEKWFVSSNNYFEVGQMYFDDKENQLTFANGRHRTSLLSKFLDEVPVSITSGIVNTVFLKKIIVRPIAYDEYIELPDLEYLTRQQLSQ